MIFKCSHRRTQRTVSNYAKALNKESTGWPWIPWLPTLKKVNHGPGLLRIPNPVWSDTLMLLGQCEVADIAESKPSTLVLSITSLLSELATPTTVRVLPLLVS